MKLFSNLKKQATSFLDQYKGNNPTTYAAAEQAIGAVLIADGLVGLENPFGEKKRPGIFGTVGGMVFGIIFMLVPNFFGSVSGMDNMTATTTATIVSVNMGSSSDGGDTCSLVANYTVDGKQYTKQSSMSSSSNCAMSEGQSISINYNPANPGSWANDVKTLGNFMLIFFFAGLIVLLSSIVTFVIRLVSIIFGWKLLKDGRKQAASLPQGTNLDTLVGEIKQNFIGTVFNFGGVNTKVSPGINDSVPQAPTQVPQANPNTPPVVEITPTNDTEIK